MTPTIRIDNQVWEYLKRKAEPFEDTPNSVLRRLFGLDRAQLRRNRRVPGRTPQSHYRIPILQTLEELGGRAEAKRVLALVFKKVKRELRPVDLQKISTGMTRWRNAAMWERKAMVDEGLLKMDSPRGMWEITDHGRQCLRKVN